MQTPGFWENILHFERLIAIMFITLKEVKDLKNVDAVEKGE